MALDSHARAAKSGLAIYGEPALAAGFEHLPYVNPDAPKGGAIRFGEVGGFDSLNPFIVKGITPWQLRYQTFESLMGRSWDEPFTLYPLLAERTEVAPDRSWIEFTLNPAARFSDGSPVTVEDVVVSMQILAEKGRPSYRATWSNVERFERIGERGVRFHFREPQREAPMILALQPILKKADVEARDFTASTLTPLIGSGPYVVGPFEPGRRITFRRDPDYWGRDLPVMRGQANFDEVIVDYFRDGNAVWEAFKAGAIDVFKDSDPARWRDGYHFARAASGGVVKSEVAHGRPSGMWGFVFNTRRALFRDVRVREALTLAFDFEWVQRTMLAGAYRRIESYFGGSPLGYSGAAEGAERAILAPHAESLPEGALDGAVTQPASDGNGRNRVNLRRAARLLKAAGWEVKDGVLRDASGAPFAFEILLGPSDDEKVAGAWAESLKRLGIAAGVRLVDRAQHQARKNDYDYDVVVNAWAFSLSPGVEQRFYWGAEGVETPGTRNYMGEANPAVQAALDALTVAGTKSDFEAAVRALDRALTAGRYVVPFWYAPMSWIAHDSTLRYPERTAIYGDWIGFLPDVWWREN